MAWNQSIYMVASPHERTVNTCHKWQSINPGLLSWETLYDQEVGLCIELGTARFTRPSSDLSKFRLSWAAVHIQWRYKLPSCTEVRDQIVSKIDSLRKKGRKNKNCGFQSYHHQAIIRFSRGIVFYISKIYQERLRKSIFILSSLTGWAPDTRKLQRHEICRL